MIPNWSARSSARRNLEARGAATLIVAEPDVTLYVKCRASAPPLVTGELARFDLAVEDVLEDSAADYERGARITSGLTYAPVPALDSEWARATLAALRHPSPHRRCGDRGGDRDRACGRSGDRRREREGGVARAIALNLPDSHRS